MMTEAMATSTLSRSASTMSGSSNRLRSEAKPSSNVCVTTCQSGQAIRKNRYAITTNRSR